MTEHQLDLFAERPPEIIQAPSAEVVDYKAVEPEVVVAAADDGLLTLFGDLPIPPARPVRLLSVYVHFERPEDVADFGRLIGQSVSTETDRIWYPPEIAFENPLWDPPGQTS